MSTKTGSASRRQRIQGACDLCKKRKSIFAFIRCYSTANPTSCSSMYGFSGVRLYSLDDSSTGDSQRMPQNRCTNCINASLDCTHADLLKVCTQIVAQIVDYFSADVVLRAWVRMMLYVAALETRVEKMERLLTKLLPGIDFTEQLENEHDVKPLLQQHVEAIPRNDEESDGFNRLKLNPEARRFFGKSSGAQLVQTALIFQTFLTGLSLPQIKMSMLSQKRTEYWTPPAQCIFPPLGDNIPQYSFPDDDLLLELVDKYFVKVNPFWPVLHRPSFDRKVADKLHLRDHKFASTLLMACSLGARHSNDPRVFLDGVDSHRPQSAGWKWHSQVRVIPKYWIYRPDLYELQTVALSTLFLQAIFPTSLCWTQVGFGVRRALDVGAHRVRRHCQAHPTAENEHWKRVFWVLMCLEWIASTLTGRPPAIHDQDIDQELPLECDDEYWDLNFTQPKEEPSQLSYFIYYIKLLEIQAAVAACIYSPRKPKYLDNQSVPLTAAKRIIAFESALNSWLEGIPEHLRWDPARTNILHSTQSALLYAAYYNVQMLLHRPFIPAPFERPPPDALPSLAICTHAARACLRIFDTSQRRQIPGYYNILASQTIFTAGVVLLLNEWSKAKAFPRNPFKSLDDINASVRIMNEAEERHNHVSLVFLYTSLNSNYADVWRPAATRTEFHFDCSAP
ncbi:fungal-specific transcription factor domain-containing protein [Mycena sanguinolenta]|nr:fungal-specific transcription factor domain-containing protein [Mycena sanguinolenta]